MVKQTLDYFSSSLAETRMLKIMVAPVLAAGYRTGHLDLGIRLNLPWLFVKMETNFKSKIIKAYKDGKIQPYAYSISIPMKDIETARDLLRL